MNFSEIAEEMGFTTTLSGGTYEVFSNGYLVARQARSVVESLSEETNRIALGYLPHKHKNQRLVTDEQGSRIIWDSEAKQ